MRVGRIIRAGLFLPLVVSIGLVLGQSAYASHDDERSGSRTVRVDCDDGDSINRAIRRSSLSQKLTIKVRGTCVENVVIDRDHVTLQPSRRGGSIEAADESKDTIRISGRHVTVQGFNGDSISGGFTGIAVDGGSVSIIDNHITDTGTSGLTGFGISLFNGAAAFISGNLIDYNVWGVVVSFNSTATFAENDILNNDEVGIVVGNTSSARLLGGNNVSSNGKDTTITLGDGVFLWRIGRVRIDAGNTFADNKGWGIFCAGTSDLSVTKADQTFDDPSANTLGEVNVEGNCFAPGLP